MLQFGCHSANKHIHWAEHTSKSIIVSAQGWPHEARDLVNLPVETVCERFLEIDQWERLYELPEYTHTICRWSIPRVGGRLFNQISGKIW